MNLRYDISNYIASVKMSSKKRILVEGRDDRSHINNLLDAIMAGHKIKVDTAENIKGDCHSTARNNRAKIEKIYKKTKSSSNHSNLFYLVDREFIKFSVDEKITDRMIGHETDGNFSWTIGHSLENYFFADELICKAYRFLCVTEYKTKAESLYKKIYPSLLRVIAVITLAAKKIDKCTYPLGTIKWQDFIIDGETISLDIENWKSSKDNVTAAEFYQEFMSYLPVVGRSDTSVCSRICRGHTAMIMLQRAFSACLFFVIKLDNEPLATAKRVAENFSKIKEETLASALSEAWVQSVKDGKAIYPENLVESIASPS